MTDLFVSEGAFAFSSDAVAVSHHHEVLRLPLLLVAGAGERVELLVLLMKVLPFGPSRLKSNAPLERKWLVDQFIV